MRGRTAVGWATRCRRQGGFSLLEVLVAFAILALTLGVLLQIFGRGARASRTAADYARAVELAESVLDMTGDELPLETGVYQGEDQGYLWTLEMTPYQPSELAAPPEQIRVLRLAVRVSWSLGEDSRGLSLVTLRSAPPGQ